MRALFVNHGAIGTMLGHVRAEESLRAGLAALPDVDARFVSLPPWGIGARAFAHPFAAGRDLEPLRWHLAESQRGRRAILHGIRDFAPDVVHVHSHTAGLLVPDVMRRIPVLLSVDTAIPDWFRLQHRAERIPSSLRPSLALERRAFHRAAAVIPWAGWARRTVAQAAPRARTVVLHPGLDTERFTPARERAPGPPRVLFVGGRFAEKGGEDLLAALEPWLAEGGHLDVVTKEPPGPRAGVRTHDLDSDDPELRSLLQQADVLCLPTYADAYPWVLLEAMASGTPVVSTPVGAIADMVPPGAGVLVAPGDIAGLRAAVDGLLSDPDRRAAMGRAARAHVVASYDARTSARALAELMRSVVADPRTPPAPAR